MLYSVTITEHTCIGHYNNVQKLQSLKEKKYMHILSISLTNTMRALNINFRTLHGSEVYEEISKKVSLISIPIC